MATQHSAVLVIYVKNKILLFCKTDKMKKFLALHTSDFEKCKSGEVFEDYFLMGYDTIHLFQET
jgi:hypothetical protein